MNEFKISLAAARVNANLTQKDVAERLRVSNKTVVNWETGISEPSYATLLLLAEMYKIPVQYIFLPVKST